MASRTGLRISSDLEAGPVSGFELGLLRYELDGRVLQGTTASMVPLDLVALLDAMTALLVRGRETVAHATGSSFEVRLVPVRPAAVALCAGAERLGPVDRYALGWDLLDAVRAFLEEHPLEASDPVHGDLALARRDLELHLVR